VEFLPYEGTITAASGPATGLTSTDIDVDEAGTEPVGWSLARTSEATTGALVWSGPAAATRGAVNVAATTPAPAPTEACDTTPTHVIGAVQEGHPLGRGGPAVHRHHGKIDNCQISTTVRSGSSAPTARRPVGR
jgi:hypothetical protein